MSRSLPLTRRAFAAFALTAGLGLHDALAADLSPHDVARYLAGMAPVPGSKLEALCNEPAWRTHAQQLDAAWKRLESEQLTHIRAWSAANVTSPNRTLLYMFSGPDYLYARSFYPDARNYVLAGLEAPGLAPNVAAMSAGERQRGLDNLRISMKTILNASFFVTADMQKELHGQGFLGVLPVLFVFLARSDMEIRSVTYVKLREDGDVESVPAPLPNRPSGVKITFYDRAKSTERTLTYFSIDLSDAGLAKSPFPKFIDKQGPSDAFFKSASYLVHGSNFARIRTALLDRTTRIIQDDTGVRLDDYNKTQWSVTAFGKYTRPIPIFDGMYQPSMARFFQESKPAPLNFRLGYGFGVNTTGLLLATRR